MNQLKTACELEHYILLAADGEIGLVRQYYFDAKTWAIRYMAVSPPDWPMDKFLLISPMAIGNVVDSEKIINIELTITQLMSSPALTADSPLTRQFEEEYYRYYRWPPYWKIETSHEIINSKRYQVTKSVRQIDESNINSSKFSLNNTADVIGSKIFATDGEVGYVNDCILDTRYWVIRYLDVTTNVMNYDNHILISPVWINNVSLKERTVAIDISCDVIQNSPKINPSLPIDRAYETRLFDYYGHRYYWRQHNSDVSDG